MMKQHTLFAERADSSVIKGIWYDHQTQLLRVHFRTTDTTWEYQGVSAYTIGQFVSSHSPGRYFNNNIRNRYHSEKVQADEQAQMVARAAKARS